MAAEGLLPAPERTVCVTGSKGKGTTARFVAWTLQRAGFRVGLVLSPDERDHDDRIRVANRPVPREDFARLYADLAPALDAVLAKAPRWYYLPPTGVFLLVALRWFRESGVDFWVLEGGRGAAFDEVGHIPCRVAIITSILDEHRDKLGPTLRQIAADKAAIAARASEVILSAQARAQLVRGGLWRAMAARATVPADESDWEVLDASLARAAVARLIGRSVVSPEDWASPSRGSIDRPQGRIWFQAGVDDASVRAAVGSGIEPAGTDVVLALSDDKAWQTAAEAVARMGFASCHWVGWEGTYLRTTRIAAAFPERMVGPANDRDGGGTLRRVLDGLLLPHGQVLFIGVQRALRQLRRAFDLPLAGPAPGPADGPGEHEDGR
jgi:dihydrofolate synthase/folylpolyglutamate synthase